MLGLGCFLTILKVTGPNLVRWVNHWTQTVDQSATEIDGHIVFYKLSSLFKLNKNG